jgi:hypothetical protein
MQKWSRPILLHQIIADKFFFVMYFILFLGIKGSSNLEHKMCRYQNQPLQYKKLKRKRWYIILIKQHTKWSRNNFTTRANVISVPTIGYRNIAGQHTSDMIHNKKYDCLLLHFCKSLLYNERGFFFLKRNHPSYVPNSGLKSLTYNL